MTSPSKTSTSTPTSSPLHGYIFWAVIAFIWICSLGNRALIHTDEGRYATISLGMLQSGDWITPRLNGLLYFEKPVLQYWAGAVSFSLFGINEFAARVWPGLTGLLTVWIVWMFSRRLWGARVGQLAAMIVAGTTWMIGNSHFLTLDMGVSFFLTLALCSFLVAQNDTTSPSERCRMMWLCWAAMAGATLSKGLIGILIPGATLFLYSLLNRHWEPWRRMHWLGGLAIYLVLTAPWFILVSQRNPGFADFFFIHEHFTRFLTREHHREGPIWYFVPVLVMGFFPWSTLLPSAFREGFRASETSLGTRRLLLTWCVFTFVFFSVSGSKLSSYILPMFPALSILLALAIDKMPAATLKRHLIFAALVYLALFAVYPLAGRLSSSMPLAVAQGMGRYLAIAGAVGLAGTALAWQRLNLGAKSLAVMILCAANLIAVTIAMASHDAYGQMMKSTKSIIPVIAPYLTPDTPVFAVQTYDQTFPFYLRRPVTLVDYRDEFALGEQTEPDRWIPDLDTFIRRWNESPRALALMTPETYDRLLQKHLPMKIVYQDSRRIVVAKA